MTVEPRTAPVGITGQPAREQMRDAGRGTLTAGQEEVKTLAARVVEARFLVLLLDYDGTLVPLAQRPEDAVPDPELRNLLGSLAARPRTAVHVVSGRPKASAEALLGDLPVGLHAEHGLWFRPVGGEWSRSGAAQSPVLGAARRLMELETAAAPGSWLEPKTLGLAWHYRGVDPARAGSVVYRLGRRLQTLLAGSNLEILEGHAVLEVSPRGVNKGLATRHALAAAPIGSTIVAIGDDQTDEDLFRALPPHALSIRVGSGRSIAHQHLEDVAAVRELLRSLV